jgi:hypothetical protein
LPRWTSLYAFLALPLAAQTPTVGVPSLFVIPNEGRNPMGPVEGIEGGAFVARASGVGAVCYNPAGLALSKKSEISSSASAYEWTFYSGEVGNVSDTSSRLSNNGRMFGFVIGEPIISNDRLHALVFTETRAGIRVISFHKVNEREEKRYEQAKARP